MTLDELSKIPDKWQVSKVEDFCEVLMGQSPPSSTYNLNGDGLPFFQGRKDFGRKYPEKKMWCSESTRVADEGDVLLSVRAPVGDVNVAIERCCIGRGVSALSMKNGNKGFLYYLMQHNRQRLKQIFESEGTVFGCVNKDGLRNFEVLLPTEVSEQQAIAKVLHDLDEKIELNHQMVKTLESIAQALFKRWFVDFDFPDNRGRPYKSSGGKMVESDYGEIPEGWSYSLAGSVSTIGIGRTPPRKEHEWFSENLADVRWVSIRDMGNVGVFVEKTAEYLTAEAVKKFNVFLVPDNTPLLSFKLTVGRVAMTDGEMVTNEAIAYFLSKHECVTNYYLYLYLKGFDYQSLGSTSSIATAFNSDTVRNMPILLPSKKIADDFFKSVSRLFDLIKFKEKEIVVLTEVRDLLLPKLMTGEVRVNSGRLS
ncbi:MAG: restriction endonuclease subunit S [Candidatus Omnitrophica bacterium]|nr:restriction endonuclease subunit S [Candidatus Omnitrophota bacterium]